MRKRTTFALAGVGLLTAIGGGFTAPAAHATTEAPYTLVLWSVPSGVDPNSVDQDYVTSTATTDLNALDGAMKCGTTYQVDLYRTVLDDGTPASSLWADGKLQPNRDGGFLAYEVLPTPYKVVTTEPCKPPAPADEVHYGTWIDQTGETSCDVDVVATHRTVTTKPYVWDVATGTWVVSTDVTTWTVVDEESTRPKTPEEQKACEPTTPPTDEPTTPTPTPTPTDQPTPTPTDEPSTTPTPSAPVTVPTPTDGTTPPPSSGTATPPATPRGSAPTTPAPSATTTAVPVAANTSPGELAYTGMDGHKLAAGVLIGAGLALIGLAIMVVRHRMFLARRRREALGDD
jgi:hypothetical protein